MTGSILERPISFTDLNTVHAMTGELVNVIGTVIDLLPARSTRGQDWMLTFTISDGVGSHKVRFFGPQKNLPPVNNLGDVVVLCKVKANAYNGSKILISSYETSWVVFPTGMIPKELPPLKACIKHERSKRAPLPSAADMQRAIDFKNGEDSSRFSAPLGEDTVKKLMQPRDKFSLIKDLVVDSFCDLVGQVVKVYWNDRGWIDLYITDYTSNKLLHNFPHPNEGNDNDDYGYSPKVKRDWPGPFGQRTILITLFPPHAEWARANVNVNNYVLLQNVNTKYTNARYMQGKMRTDLRDEDRIGVIILDREDERVKNVLRRKRDYEKEFRAQTTQNKQQGQNERRDQHEARHRPERRPLLEIEDKNVRINLAGNEMCDEKRKFDDAENNGPQTKLSRGQKRRKKAKEAKQKAKQDLDPQQQTERDRSKSGGRGASEGVTHESLGQLNTNVRCNRPEYPSRSVADILDTAITHKRKLDSGMEVILPFNNKKSRTVVRAVDFKPPRLEDFCYRKRLSEYDGLDGLDDSRSDGADASGSSDGGKSDSDTGVLSGAPSSTSHKWVWAFDLLVEDANPGVPAIEVNGKRQRERMVVKVCEADAMYLLKIDPVDLRNDAQALGQLRERLFLLWGDLQERKQKKLEESSDGKASMEHEPSTARPFAMWVQEYGRRIKGTDAEYLRLMRLTETTIV